MYYIHRIILNKSLHVTGHSLCLTVLSHYNNFATIESFVGNFMASQSWVKFSTCFTNSSFLKSKLQTSKAGQHGRSNNGLLCSHLKSQDSNKDQPALFTWTGSHTEAKLTARAENLPTWKTLLWWGTGLAECHSVNLYFRQLVLREPETALTYKVHFD